MLFSALWRALPGPTPAKAVQALLLVAVVVAFLFLWLFPRIAPMMPFNENTVGASSSTGTATPAPPLGWPLAPLSPLSAGEPA
jgi:hypothetical protein